MDYETILGEIQIADLAARAGGGNEDMMLMFLSLLIQKVPAEKRSTAESLCGEYLYGNIGYDVFAKEFRNLVKT
jgi:hypothetical protein